MTKRTLTAALDTVDLPAAVAALDQDVVFHSPILATTGDEVRGHPPLCLQTAFACYGMPRNVEEFQNPDRRYIVTFDGSIDGNLIQIAILVTENAAKKAESIRLSRAHGRSSSCSASAWSVTYVRIRSPTLSGICQQLMRYDEDVLSLAAISFPSAAAGG
jgi:hypothetical protein